MDAGGGCIHRRMSRDGDLRWMLDISQGDGWVRLAEKLGRKGSAMTVPLIFR